MEPPIATVVAEVAAAAGGKILVDLTKHDNRNGNKGSTKRKYHSYSTKLGAIVEVKVNKRSRHEVAEKFGIGKEHVDKWVRIYTIKKLQTALANSARKQKRNSDKRRRSARF